MEKETIEKLEKGIGLAKEIMEDLEKSHLLPDSREARMSMASLRLYINSSKTLIRELKGFSN